MSESGQGGSASQARQTRPQHHPRDQRMRMEPCSCCTPSAVALRTGYLGHARGAQLQAAHSCQRHSPPRPRTSVTPATTWEETICLWLMRTIRVCMCVRSPCVCVREFLFALRLPRPSLADWCTSRSQLTPTAHEAPIAIASAPAAATTTHTDEGGGSKWHGVLVARRDRRGLREGLEEFEFVADI